MELTITLPEGSEAVGTTGPGERNLKMIREALGVKLWSRRNTVHLSGQPERVSKAVSVIEQLREAARQRHPMEHQQLLDTLASVGREAPSQSRLAGASIIEGPEDNAQPPINPESLDVYLQGRRIRPRTDGQRAYVKAMLSHDLSFCFGPAGTGKTYLAVASAVAMLKRGKVRKLILVRPAVEAGEKLGFLPGSMQEKVNPYLRPLLDALHDMMEFEQVQRLMTTDVIEVVPLAFMRGRTLNDAWIILDEAQNTTRSQMMMFLTRLGHSSKMVVTGDTSQVDLEDPRQSGLIDAARRLAKVPGIAMLSLDKADIVRHSLVQRIVNAYERSGVGDRRPAPAAADHPEHAAAREAEPTKGSPSSGALGQPPTESPAEPPSG